MKSTKSLRVVKDIYTPYRDERRFGLLFVGIFALVAFWPLWPLPAPNFYWLGGAAIWLAAALIYPRMLSPLYKRWIAFGGVLGWINARVILGIVFYLLVTPIALIMKLLGHDPLNRCPRRDSSHWIERGESIKRESMRDQF